MFRWFINRFFGRSDHQNERIDEATRPGTRVQRQQDGLEGTLSGMQLVDGACYARVVFTGVRATWIELIHVAELQAVRGCVAPAR